MASSAHPAPPPARSSRAGVRRCAQRRPGVAADDGCKASCVDWYGNARPIFLGDRVLALMGYEIVEGRLQAGGWRIDEPSGVPAEQIVERRRIGFAPNAAWREGRYSPFN